ncbi:DUF2254 domain-containing protein [Paracoccus aerodenitrificans]|uniref:DUF2254 domain-containing protein n=1 Tax=Paracoccus aerodenitrificans TaxID=3017781 RepID=UPI0022F05D18|nr:DUF2254 domain-containing protein [Paracoccus aerodenitrificans]WBU63729.1 DUF2254 domain-containing protein [Paracoccus aerodenitrificans]
MFGWIHGAWMMKLREQLRKMWIRVTLYSFAGIALALVAQFIGPFLPYVPKIDLASGSVGSLLNIIASSMLAVTTFSMSIIVSAYSSATSNATPRSTRLLEGDSVAQTAVSVFVGSFLFSIVGIIGLSAGQYPDNARVLLFIATLLDIFLITWALLRWVNHLNEFGRMSDIIDRIESASMPSARLYREWPSLGAESRQVSPDEASAMVLADQSGYVRYIDMAELQKAAETADIKVGILRMPGKYVHRGEPLLRLSAGVEDKFSAALHRCFTLGDSRSFEQDLQYGLTVLGEVASKALSPGINDPGTAIEVLRAGTRVLQEYHQPPEDGLEPAYDRVSAPPLDVSQIYTTFFAPIARDGGGLFEVQQTLLDCLDVLAQSGHLPAARREAERARNRAAHQLTEDWEKRLLGIAEDAAA